jgi:hypothetical protein
MAARLAHRPTIGKTAYMSRTEPVTPALYSAKLVDRLVGIFRFDSRAFDAVRHDPRATRQALIIVMLTGLGPVVGPGTRPSVWQVATPLLGVVCWMISALIMVQIGTRLLGALAPNDGCVQLLRLLGFVPIVSIAGVVQLFGLPVPEVYLFSAFLLWGLALVVKAVRHTVGLQTAPAIATVLLAEMLILALFLPTYFLFRSWGWA